MSAVHGWLAKKCRWRTSIDEFLDVRQMRRSRRDHAAGADDAHGSRADAIDHFFRQWRLASKKERTTGCPLRLVLIALSGATATTPYTRQTAAPCPAF